MPNVTACLDIAPTLPASVIVILILIKRAHWRFDARLSAGTTAPPRG